MSKFIYVQGDSDYGAAIFEESEWFDKREELFNKAKSKDGTTGITLNEGEDEEEFISIQALEFGEVDENFTRFVLDELCDYDSLKQRCIYKVD